MPPLPEPPRCACPKCSYDLRGIESDGHEVQCPECGVRSLPEKLGVIGGPLKGPIRLLYLKWGLGGGMALAPFLTVALTWFLLSSFEHAWSNAPQKLSFLGIVVIAVPMLGWIALLKFAERSFLKTYTRHGWDRPQRRAKRTAGKLILMHIAVLPVGWLLLWMLFSM